MKKKLLHRLCLGVFVFMSITGISQLEELPRQNLCILIQFRQLCIQILDYNQQ